MADRIAVMNAGRIVQVGTPQELYDRPASRFVADFLGEANFLDGEVVSAASLRRSERPRACCSPPARCAREGRRSRPLLRAPEQVRFALGRGRAPEHGRRRGERPARHDRVADVPWRDAPVRRSPFSPCNVEGHQPHRVGVAFAPGQRVELLVSSADVAVLPES